MNLSDREDELREDFVDEIGDTEATEIAKGKSYAPQAVSYTHLTLPTILLV